MMGRRAVGTPPDAAASDGERLAAVAAASRAGASATDAWREWGADGGRAAGGGGAGGRAAGGGAAGGGAARGTMAVVDGVPDLGRSDPLARDVIAAARLAHSSGVPLADLVSALARVEAAREAARLSREASLAGPRASARLLGWLPIAGLTLGAIVEPRTLVVLAATPFGWVLCAVATALVMVGRRWMSALVRGAAEAGRVP